MIYFPVRNNNGIDIELIELAANRCKNISNVSEWSWKNLEKHPSKKK